MNIDAKKLGFAELNNEIRNTDEDCLISNCCGQRFIAAGMSDKKISVSGIPGNALGAYLNGAVIDVEDNAQTLPDMRCAAARFLLKETQAIVRGFI